MAVFETLRFLAKNPGRGCRVPETFEVPRVVVARVGNLREQVRARASLHTFPARAPAKKRRAYPMKNNGGQGQLIRTGRWGSSASPSVAVAGPWSMKEDAVVGIEPVR